MKRLTLAAMLIAIAGTAIAGDVANLINLGFSADSKYFMFGQYGVDLSTGKPYAEIYVVDASKNDFVPSGVLRRSYDIRPEAGFDGDGAFYSLFAESIPLAKKYGIDHLKTGRTLYFLAGEGEAPATISFRDFKKESAYERFDVAISQASEEKSGKWRSSFGLTLKATTKSGQVTTLPFGNPGYWRDGVKGYTIRQIVMAPDEKTIVVIVEKRYAGAIGESVRFMVETVKIQ
jgi:predicted secreted protein